MASIKVVTDKETIEHLSNIFEIESEYWKFLIVVDEDTLHIKKYSKSNRSGLMVKPSMDNSIEIR